MGVFTAAGDTDRAPKSPKCRKTEGPKRRRARKTGESLKVAGEQSVKS